MSRYDRAAEPDDREQKLPRWAQEKLGLLRAKVSVLEDKLAEVPLTPDTLVVTDRYSDHPNPVKLGRRDSVTFFVREFDSPDSFDVRIDDDGIYVQASDSVAVIQDATNTLRLRFRRGLLSDRVAERRAAVAREAEEAVRRARAREAEKQVFEVVE